MVEGQPRGAFVVGGGQVLHQSPHVAKARTASPTTSPLTSIDCGKEPSRSFNRGSSTPSPMLPRPGVRDRATPQSESSNVHSSVQHSLGSDYIINRLVSDIEAGVFPTDGPVEVGGGGSHNMTAAARLSPRPPTPGSGNVNVVILVAVVGGSSNSPSNIAGGGGSSVGERAERGRRRPPNTPKNMDRWGEEETTVLCQARNEAKTFLGEETEAMGRGRAKAGFWKVVEDRMWERGYNRDHEQCKGKFSQVLDFYQCLKIQEGWSGLPSYWDMNQMKRKRYNFDFVIRRAWFDTINVVEKDNDSINLSHLRDSGAKHEWREEGNHGAGGAMRRRMLARTWVEDPKVAP
ncbi:hypothetical protein CBR_g45549 [Chara braunii]|uniref:Myb/SANT-like DNA-binding domain-containing protein n=1 Tax=Chara braunii TaxID=69332 RepID=A0A388LYT6_CHABU|nr:hypothetical protein CBR_g45549 [Chara braunii]|eukprot:GBG87490.1 hypothetical protein CBR_g45549 [Chara braunii]